MIANKAHSKSADFRRFCCQLFHASLATIFSSLKPGMTIPEVVLCPDGHFRLIIWELGPYIADYPKQVLLCCIVQGWCPKYVFFFPFKTLQLSPGFKWNLAMACQKLELPEFPKLLRRFLYNQIYPDAQILSSDVSIDACPVFVGKISVFYSASATFRAPSDPSGPRSMRCEYIRATPTWRKGHSQYDCVFVNAHLELPGMRGLEVARVFLFFSFMHQGTCYPCALVQWFSFISDEPDAETGYWMVEPDVHQDGQPYLAVIHLDSIFRTAHLVPAYHTSDFVR